MAEILGEDCGGRWWLSPGSEARLCEAELAAIFYRPFVFRMLACAFSNFFHFQLLLLCLLSVFNDCKLGYAT